jgi:hypothetical protein
MGQQIEMLVGSTAINSFLPRSPLTKQLIEHVARIANHRQRLIRRPS